ncbi:MAG: MAC/Perforin domain protein [Syntrophorhabdus sp. PtaB.Bin006]|nr:MAG: MAC/Perforin domain protein [Syntrophorhabdus sp. PtaB.Bin006]
MRVHILLAALFLFFASLTCAASEELAGRPLRSLDLPGAEIVKVQKSPACPEGICSGLGNAFYLPRMNALSVKTGGNSFFVKSKLGECARLSKVSQNSRSFETADSMEKLSSYVMAEADLSGSYHTAALTVKGSVEAMTSSSSNVTTTFHSTHMDINVTTHSIDFQQDSTCFSESNIDKSFLNHFESLALIDPSQVGSASSWQPYVQFLSDQGSHIMMQQQIGSRFQQWESSVSTEYDLENKLKAKACAQVEGTQGGGGWSVKGCAAYSKEDKEKALKTSSKSLNVVLGGTGTSRANLTKEVSKANLDAFIDSATKGDQATRFIFKPIWDLLISIYTPPCSRDGKGSKACANLQRAVNLQAAYEGWTAIGCPKEVDGKQQVYQTMKVSGNTTLGINTYECWLSKTGCRSDDSCHIGGWGSVTYCYGPDCIDSGEQIPGTKMSKNKVRGNQEGSYKEGVNNSCYYKKVRGYCDTSWLGGLPERTIYQQSTP